MRRRALVVAVVMIVMVVAAACGSTSHVSRPSSRPSRTTTVVLLTHDAFAVSKPVLAAFTAQTGYKVKLLQPCDAGCMVTQAIERKNHPVADALFGVDNTFLTRALDAGIFSPYTPRAAASLPPDLRVDPRHRVTAIDTGYVCLNYDTTWFGRSGRPPAPTSIASLVEPPYRNLTVMENPATSSPGLAFLLATIDALGPNGWQAYWRQLRANGVRVVDDWTQAYETDFTVGGGKGDRPIVVSYASSPPADVVFSSPHRDTSRVGVVTSSCFRQIEFAGVLAGAHNVAGARALVDFLLSRAFQADMPLQMYVNPVVPGTPLPALYERLTAKPLHPYTMDPPMIGAHRDAWIKEWTDIVLR